jgi:nicotinamide-nucleotide amidase
MKRTLIILMVTLAVAATAEPAARLNYRIVITGGEMLDGVYPDAHTHFLTRTLHPLGVHCVGSTIVDDVREEMLDALKFAVHDSALVIVTGGLGPTPNDVTRETLSEFTGISLREQPEVVEGMARRLKQPKEQLRANLRKQAQVPTRGTYLKSASGTAVGLVFELDKTVIVALPGPPRELQAMVTNELVPYLRRKFGVRPLGASLTLRFVGVGQSQITQTIKDQVTVPPEVIITSLFEGGRVDFTFSLASNTPAAEATLARLKEQILAKLGDYFYADDGSSLEDAVIKKLKATGSKLALAEVCTGGQLAAALNSATGAATALAGAYAAPTEETLARLLGAKSASDAKELALAAAQRTQSAWALAVGQPQEADGGKWALAALKTPGGQVATQRLAVRGSDEAARAQLVTQLLDFLRRQVK